MSKINVLGFDIANLIAAGEVVDRPASVVKELMENAIDAGARSLTVEIKAGGTTFIRVTDDGCGIEKDELPIAILRHATSKIRDVTDLSEIMTLGFRGEALAAISSVSRLRITSKVPGADLGAVLSVEYGEVTDLSDAGCPDGTTVVCESLFANVPARRKFLKKDSTETAAVTAVVEKIALSSPQIAIRYIADRETRFQTPGNSDLTGVIYVIYGREVASRLRHVERSEGGLSVDGFVSEPDFFRPNRNMMNFFINHRYVKSRTMGAAVEQAYATHIPSDKFPFCIINFTVNPQAVDVNVHPSKLEVKFTNERLVFEAVYYAVLNALQSETGRPELELGSRGRGGASGYSRHPGGAQAPASATAGAAGGAGKSFWVSGEEASKLLASFASGDRAERGTQLRLDGRDAPVGTKTSDGIPGIVPGVPSTSGGEKNSAGNAAEAPDTPENVEITPLSGLEPEDRERYTDIVTQAPYPIGSAPAEYSLAWVAEKYGSVQLSEQLKNEPLPDIPDIPDAPDTHEAPELPGVPDGKYPEKVPGADGFAAVRGESTDVGAESADIAAVSAAVAANSADIGPKPADDGAESSVPAGNEADVPEFAVDSASGEEAHRIPEYVILGEAFNCYIIAQLEDRLVLIDKHAAHERIIFDSLVRKMKCREKHAQMLMFPIEITLTDVEKDAVREFEDSIRAVGFAFTFTDGGLDVSAIPEELSRESATDMIIDLAGSLAENLGTIESVGNEYFEARLYQASCKAAIKGGRIYARDNLRYICDRVLREPKPGESAISTCPHGRPVAFEIRKNSIERQFQRLV